MSDLPKISGFTFIKNGIELGYPFVESIKSLELLCDEIIINVGFDGKDLKKDDGTFELVSDLFKGPKFKIIKSWWDPEKTTAGLILSEQTNIALGYCSGEYCQYLQGDEVLHENDIDLIRKSIVEMEKRNEVEGLVFNYTHFYGNVDIVKYTRNVYRREVRLFRNNMGIKSWLDAQGFKTIGDKKLNCIQTSASIFHYGWARKEAVMQIKVNSFGKLYHGKSHEDNSFSYKRIWGLRPFKGSHPLVMNKWITKNMNSLDIMSLKLDFKLRDLGLVFSDYLEKLTGHRFGEYKNYKMLKD